MVMHQADTWPGRTWMDADHDSKPLAVNTAVSVCVVLSLLMNHSNGDIIFIARLFRAAANHRRNKCLGTLVAGNSRTLR